MNDQTVDPADAELLRRLGAIAESVDPAPELVRELGRAALSFRRPDSELADLVADSAEQPLTVRSGAAGDLGRWFRKF